MSTYPFPPCGEGGLGRKRVRRSVSLPAQLSTQSTHRLAGERVGDIVDAPLAALHHHRIGDLLALIVAAVEIGEHARPGVGGGDKRNFKIDDNWILSVGERIAVEIGRFVALGGRFLVGGDGAQQSCREEPCSRGLVAHDSEAGPFDGGDIGDVDGLHDGVRRLSRRVSSGCDGEREQENGQRFHGPPRAGCALLRDSVPLFAIVSVSLLSLSRGQGGHFPASNPSTSVILNLSGAWICGEWPRSGNATSFACGMRATASFASTG